MGRSAVVARLAALSMIAVALLTPAELYCSTMRATARSAGTRPRPVPVATAAAAGVSSRSAGEPRRVGRPDAGVRAVTAGAVDTPAPGLAARPQAPTTQRVGGGRGGAGGGLNPHLGQYTGYANVFF